MAQPADTDTQNMGKSNNIAAIVVCYHPESELLRTNVGAFAGDVERVLVWRNSADDLGWLKEEFGNVEFMGDGENAFIARPLNEALRYCADKGYKWLLTMDQDSVLRILQPSKKIYSTARRATWPFMPLTSTIFIVTATTIRLKR